MRTYVYPADTSGCGYYRLIWVSQYLASQGYDVEIVLPHQRGASIVGHINTRDEIVDVTIPDDAETMVFQRISHKHMVGAVELIRRKNVAVVIDVDDDLSTIHPNNPAFDAFHPKREPYEHNWQNVERACRAATLVTVSTPQLLPAYASSGNGIVIPNYVPQRYLDIDHTDSNLLGWGGSMRSHPNDLQVMGNAIARVVSDGVPFRVVGPGDGVRIALNLQGDLDTTGTLELQSAWPEGLAQLGVGVAPLADTKFNAAKSHLKMLEMAALGVPCVVSPRAAYQRLNRRGVGVVADTPKKWYQKLTGIVNNTDLRLSLSSAGRGVARTMTIENHADEWLQAWTYARDMASQHSSVSR